MSTGEIEIGPGVTIEFTSWRDNPRAGLLHWHRRPDNGEQCCGGVLFDRPGVRDEFPGRPVWRVEQEDPLSLSPSLLCTTCGHHGWIRNGIWQPA